MSIGFDFDCDWPDLWPFNERRWRAFTLLSIEGESSDYKYIEIHLALLGLHVMFHWFRGIEEE